MVFTGNMGIFPCSPLILGDSLVSNNINNLGHLYGYVATGRQQPLDMGCMFFALHSFYVVCKILLPLFIAIF